MTTVRQAISDIENKLNSYNLDDRYSQRFLFSELRGNIENFLKQDAVDRTILNINELWKPLVCIELKDADLVECAVFYENCNKLKKSVKKIPSVYTTKYGNLIKILNINNSLEYIQIKPFEYKNLISRQYTSKKIKYYWIEDDYLYIPDSMVEEVRGYGLFKDSQQADLFNGHIDECYLPLDSVLLIPDYIIDISKKQVVSELLQASEKIEDNDPDLDTQTK